MPVHQRHAALGRMFALQQANPIDHPGQRPDGIGPARIAYQENPVTGAIVTGKPAIGATDQTVESMALNDGPAMPPPLPLQPRFVIDIALCRPTGFRQQPVDLPDIRLLTHLQA